MLDGNFFLKKSHLEIWSENFFSPPKLGANSPPMDRGTAVLTAPPKFKLRRDSAWSWFVRSHKEYVIDYNFEALIVKFQFPLYIMTSGGCRGTLAPSLKH